MAILLINACVRENSRTLVLAKDVIKSMSGDVIEVNLNTANLPPLNRALLAERERLIQEEAWDHPLFRYAKQFAAAEEIVIAAPFWDLSFPAVLKTYLEHVTVSGITFTYQDGHPAGLCRAKRLTYVTTAGGPIVEDFGYPYVKALAKNFYGIPETVAYRAANMDVEQIPADAVLTQAAISVIR